MPSRKKSAGKPGTGKPSSGAAAQSSARATVSGPARKGGGQGVVDVATAKEERFEINAKTISGSKPHVSAVQGAG